ncbi:MAG: AAA family ATPase [Acidobacteriota bacterium]|nr:AAA family ATPase [Acidobacteriota bacterium]
MITIPGYHIGHKIYESGGSLVFRGSREEDGRAVILKILKNDYPTPRELTRYCQEFDITRSLQLPGVIEAIELRKYHNTLVMILEDFGGESLRLLHQQTPFTIDEVLDLACRVAPILAKVHDQHVIHKDLNPSNLVFNRETGELKIIDFGIATRLARSCPAIGNPEGMEGTLLYMSPEQTGRMNRMLDYRTDFYSLGATLFELLCGEPPFVSEDPIELVHAHLARQADNANERNPNVPHDLSAVIAKLLAKTAEERYQSAWGIATDLKACRTRRQKRDNTPFVPGAYDISSRFQISQSLYGREREAATLTAGFEKAARGESVFVLVSGYSGIGKSSLIREIHKPVTRRHGHFVSGKYDQYQRLPYGAIAAAFRELVRQLLTEQEEHLEAWRNKLLTALGVNGSIIIDVIPEVELIIGPQGKVPELGPAETAARLRMVFLRFVSVFCAVEHPMVLFLDDLQWADNLSLELIGLMVSDETIRHLMLIGAYRDNEVDGAHPLMRRLKQLKESGTAIQQVEVSTLGQSDIEALIADSLRRPRAEVKELARLVLHKSGGNPFFVNQFLTMLYEEELLTFQPPTEDTRGGWLWDMDGIEEQGFTDNVVDLMIGKLNKLPPVTRELLRTASCAGGAFYLGFLAAIHNKGEAETFNDLLPAIREGFVLTTTELETVDDELVVRGFTFLHDRVRQAAYELLSDDERRELHLHMGRLLLERLDRKEQEEHLFEIVDHLNAGWSLIETQKERMELAMLNLSAARRTRKATAYDEARRYLEIGYDSLLACYTVQDAWETHYEMTLALHVERADAEYLTRNFEQAERFLELAVEGARTPVEKAKIYSHLVVQYTMEGRYQEAVAWGVRALALLNVDIDLENAEAGFMEDLQAIQAVMESGGDISALVHAPEISDPSKVTALDTLAHMLSPAFLSLVELYPVFAVRQARLSLEWGVCSSSSLGFACFGHVLCALFDRFEEGYELGMVGYRLGERFGDPVNKSRACLLISGFLNPWSHHLRDGLGYAEEGFGTALECGSVQWAGYNAILKVFCIFSLGTPLPEVLSEVEVFLQMGRKTGNRPFTSIMHLYQHIILNLTGGTEGPEDFNTPDLSEQEMIAEFDAMDNNNARAQYGALKAMVYYLYGRYEKALEQAAISEKLFVYLQGTYPSVEHTFYQAMAAARVYETEDNEERRTELRTKIDAARARFQVWAKSSPKNFQHRLHLIDAEIARINDNPNEATRLFDMAAENAGMNGFVHDEALANELSGRCWLDQGRRRIAAVYLRDAHHGYRMWGAMHKVAELEGYAPRLASLTSTTSTHTTTTTMGSVTGTGTEGSEHLDLGTVLKASRAISSEIVLDELLEKLMRILLENAGAQRGSLLLPKQGRWIVKAQLEVDQNKVLFPSENLENTKLLSAAIVNYGIKTRENVVLDDAAGRGMFTTDSYVINNQPKSVLCAPILHHGKLRGLLYLENNLATGTFTTSRLTLLKLLSSQAAVSIENARLYADMEQLVEERTARLQETLRELERQHEQLKKTKNQLVQSEKMASLGTLTAGIAHELKNPLNFINNFSYVSLSMFEELREELGRMEGPPNDEVDELLNELYINAETINKHGVQADRIVMSMMNLARGETGERRVVSINEHLDEYVQLGWMGSRGREGGASLEILKDYDETVGELEVVPQDLGRVWVNLINNAADALMEKRERLGESFQPRLVIATRNDGDHIEVRIRDNGPGIPADVQAKIFDPFFTSKPPGTGHIGMGLPISFDIVVSSHQGKITVDTEPGEFTQFAVRLPKA